MDKDVGDVEDGDWEEILHNCNLVLPVMKRTYASGSQKRKKRKEEEDKKKQDSGKW